MSRERRPSAIRQFGEQTGDEEFKKLLREYQKQKPKKPVMPAESKVKVVEDDKKSSFSSKTVSKVGKDAKAKAKHETVVVLTPQARLQEELEEKHIARGRERKSRVPKPRKILPEGAVDLPDIETAIKRGVKESSTLLLDWASPKAKMIGFLCKVYWDGEDIWFYARILNYDSFYDRHYIYYLEDSTAEWINLATEIVLVGEELVFARLNPGGAPWAAQRYWISEKAQSVCHNFPGFHKGGEYVEYLSDQKNKEYAFLQRKCLDPMHDKYLPSKQSAAFKKSMKAAENERQAIDEVLEAVQSAIRESVFSALSGEQWVGYRVRASTHRILQPGERRVDARDAGGSAYSTGTVKCYRPSSGEHLVVFDDHMLQPQWVVCQKSQIDVLLGEEGAKPSSEGAVAAEPGIAAACTFHLTVCKGQAVDYSVQCNCVLCDNALVQGTFRRCTKCGLKCHSYCLIEDTAAPGAESAVPQYWPVSTALPWTCWNCVECFGCQTNSWDKALLAWNAQRVEPEGPDLDMLVCGDCLYRYKHVKDFCPSCFKLYAMDDSMQPLYGATLSVTPAPPAHAAAQVEVGADGVTCTVAVLAPDDSAVSGSLSASRVDGALADDDAGELLEPMEVDSPAEAADSTIEGDDAPQCSTQAASSSSSAASCSAPKQSANSEANLAEENMVECNECSRWVHAHCEGIDKAQYDAMTLGTHPIWGDEYLCPLCRVKISKAIIKKMQNQDQYGMFAEPVTEKVARNYYDVIRNPMDMATMSSKAARGLYKSLQALRQDFELMCLNAMVFNTDGDEYWREAQRFHLEVQHLFDTQRRKSHGSAYGFELQQLIAKYNAEQEAIKASKIKKRKGGSTSTFDAELAKLGGESNGATGSTKRSKVSSDLGTSSVTSDVLSENMTDAGDPSPRAHGQQRDASGAPDPKQENHSAADKDEQLDEHIFVPDALVPSPDPSSFLPCTVVSQSIEEAYYLMCQEACLVCGASGRAELMLFCVDCGEAVHSFCSDAPLSLMPEEARAGWRCMNCKICKCCNIGFESETIGKLLYCEGCDEAFHSKCVTPIVTTLPENSWFCGGCVKCTTCETHTGNATSVKDKPWGFEISQCYDCHLVHAKAKAQAEALLVARQLPSNCNVCCHPVAPPSVMCTACGRYSHVACNPATALPTVSNNLENYRDFLCRVCVNQFLPACTSHIGSGEAATALLVAVARIQRVRNVQRHAVQARAVKELDVERRGNYESHRQVFRAIIHLAVQRVMWLGECNGAMRLDNAPATMKMFPNYISGRSLRFLSLYRRRAGCSSVDLPLRRQRLLVGLDQDTGLEMSSERLVRIASLASAFLHSTNPDVRLFLTKAQELAPAILFLESLYGSGVQTTAEQSESAREALMKFISSFGDIGKFPVHPQSQSSGSSTSSSVSTSSASSVVTSLAFAAAVNPSAGNSGASEPVNEACNKTQYSLIVAHFLEYCIDNLSRSPIGLDSSDVHVTAPYCAGFSLHNSAIAPTVSRHVVSAVPWKPGNIMTDHLLSRKKTSTMLSPERGVSGVAHQFSGEMHGPSVSVSSSAPAGSRNRQSRNRISGAGNESSRIPGASSAEQVTVDLRYGDGYFAHKARTCSLVPRVLEVPAQASVAALLVRPDVVIINSATEQARKKVMGEIAVRARLTNADPDYLAAVGVMSDIMVKIEKRLGAGNKSTKAATAVGAPRGNLSTTSLVTKSELDLEQAKQVVTCVSCDKFDPSKYTYEATPAKGMFGWQSMGDAAGPGAERAWQDPRSCCLCLDVREDDVVGHLLPCFDGFFAHVNCLRWSPEVTEVDGLLRNAIAGRERGLRTSCYYCNRKGATVTCHKKCRRSFHVRCAIACNCALMETRPMRGDGKTHDIQTYSLCPEHIATLQGNTNYKHLWRPNDPTRSLLIEENHDANFTADLLSQRRSDKAVRVGSVTILSVGKPLPTNASFYNEQYVYPHRFRSTRIYWSAIKPFERTLYTFEVFLESDFESLDVSKQEYIRRMLEKCDSANSTQGSGGSGRSHSENDDRPEKPVFRILAMDDPTHPIFSYSVSQAFKTVVKRVHDCNMQHSKVFARCILNRQHNETYGFTPHQFFGVGLPFVRKAIEMLPETLSMMISFNRDEPKPLYRPVYQLPTLEAVAQLQQQMLRALEGSATSINGCVRADGYGQGDKRFTGKRITRILTKVADVGEPAKNKAELNQYELRDDEDENKRVNEALKARYTDMTAAYLVNPYAKLDVRKSGIHGWGLFAKTNFERNDIIVEYIGQKIRQVIADRREVQYEDEGVGSCYLFRLDKEDIIDATRRGGMARFINHCCEPNAYARVISLNLKSATSTASASTAEDHVEDKHIIIMAARDIQEGEEVTYDYKFPIEDSKLKCYCGAACCGGFMN